MAVGKNMMCEKGTGIGKQYLLSFNIKSLGKNINMQELYTPLSYLRPDAIVLQCGADSLANDRLGCFNLSIKVEITILLLTYPLWGMETICFFFEAWVKSKMIDESREKTYSHLIEKRGGEIQG